MLVNVFYLVALACFMLCLKYTAGCSTKVKKFWYSFYYTIFWNMPIRVFIEGYMPTAHQFLTEMRDGLEWKSALKVIYNSSSLVQIFLVFVAPLVLYRFFRWKTDMFRMEKFRRRFGDSTDILSHRRSSSSVFFLTFCYKRLFITWFIVYAEKGYWQVMGTMLAVQFSVIIQGMANPFRKPSDRRLEFFNEASTLLWCHCLFTFTYFVPEPARRYEMGYVLIVLVILNFLINILYVYWHGPPKFTWWLKKKYNKYVEPCR